VFQSVKYLALIGTSAAPTTAGAYPYVKELEITGLTSPEADNIFLINPQACPYIDVTENACKLYLFDKVKSQASYVQFKRFSTESVFAYIVVPSDFALGSNSCGTLTDQDKDSGWPVDYYGVASARVVLRDAVPAAQTATAWDNQGTSCALSVNRIFN
jgi:hypothetical protein